MNRSLLAVATLTVLLSAGCGRLGVGLPSCETSPERPTTAVVLAAQAVPGAAYGPCINSLKLGWDEVSFDVESGEARISVGREFGSFLDVTLTPSCDVEDAVAVPSEIPGVERYEAVTRIDREIRVTLIPTGERPRIHALALAKDLAATTIHDRPVVFSVDEDVDFSVRQRVNQALFTDQYVWIINDLDTEEGTLELRRSAAGEGARGLGVHEALERIEDMTPDVSYRGQWYFVFAGGCITYDFDAKGRVADTIESDAAEAFGLYPNDELRDAARRSGFDLTGEQ